MDGPAAKAPNARRPDPDDDLAVDRRDIPETDRQDPPCPCLPPRRDGRRVALATDLAERRQGAQLAAGSPVELAKRTAEGRGVPDGDDEDVRGHIPRLVGDDADSHGYRILLRARSVRRMCARDRGMWSLSVATG